MKKLITTFLILFLVLCGFAEEPKYTEESLLNYLTNYPGASLPAEGERIEIQDGLLSVVSASIDGPGMDYIVKYSGASFSPLIYSKMIYIYSETMQTRKYWIEGNIVINATPITIYYTGQTAPAINENGNRVELPVFIAE